MHDIFGKILFRSLIIVLPNCLLPSANSNRVLTFLKISYFSANSTSHNNGQVPCRKSDEHQPSCSLSSNDSVVLTVNDVTNNLCTIFLFSLAQIDNTTCCIFQSCSAAHLFCWKHTTNNIIGMVRHHHRNLCSTKLQRQHSKRRLQYLRSCHVSCLFTFCRVLYLFRSGQHTKRVQTEKHRLPISFILLQILVKNFECLGAKLLNSGLRHHHHTLWINTPINHHLPSNCHFHSQSK